MLTLHPRKTSLCQREKRLLSQAHRHSPGFDYCGFRNAISETREAPMKDPTFLKHLTLRLRKQLRASTAKYLLPVLLVPVSLAYLFSANSQTRERTVTRP